MGELVEDSVNGSVDLGGPLPMSSAAPDVPSSSIQTQFNKVAGQKQRDLGQLGDGGEQGPAQTTDESAGSLKGAEDTASTNDPNKPTDSAAAGDAMASLLKPEPASSDAKPVAAKAAAPPDWASAVESQMRQGSSAFVNPFQPTDNDPRNDLEVAYHSALAVSRAWNALTDPNGTGHSVKDTYNDNSVQGKLKLAVLAALFPPARLTLFDNPAKPMARWLTENALPLALTAGADFSMPTFALSMIGTLPDDPSQVPGQIAGASPPGVIAAALADPKKLLTPEGASQLFWKYLSSVLMTASVLPVAHNAVRPFINPETLAAIDKGVVAAKIGVPHDVTALPTAAELMPEAAEIPNVPSRSVVAPAAGNEVNVPATLNKDTGQVEVSLRSQAAQERSMLAKLGLESWGQFAEKAPQMSDEQVNAAKQAWSDYMPYDLVRQMPEDRTASLPSDHLDQVAPANRGAYNQALAATTTTLAHIRSGPFAQEANAVDSLVHSLLPQHRATDWLMQQALIPALGKLGAAAKLNGEAIQRALRDPDAYDTLSPEGKGVVDMWDLLSRTIRDERAKVGFPTGAVPAFDPRVPMSVEDQIGKLTKQVQTNIKAGGPSPLVSGNRAHRAEAFAVDPNNPDQVVLTEKHPDVFSINKDQASRQAEMAMKLINEGNPTENAVARAAAAFPLYHTDFFKAMSQQLPQSIHSLHSYQAADMLSNSLTPEGNRLAYQLGEKGIPAGYKSIDSATGAYRNMQWHPEFADRMNKLNQDFDLPGGWKVIDKLNNVGRSLVMASPTIHAENLLGRAVDLTLTHPSATLDQVLGKGAHDDPMVRSLMRQLEAFKAGVVPHLSHRGSNVDELYGQQGRVTGDQGQFDIPGLRDTQTASVGLKSGVEGLGRAIGGGYQYLQNRLWQGAANFAVDAYHIEKAALDARFPPEALGQSHNVSEEGKQLFAANRANQWQGRLAPENWNRMSYMMSRLLFFAPNWQRTFYELMAPTYNTRALAATPELRRYMWANDLHTIRGMAMAQFFTGNAMNMMLSGHPQWENDPGNTHKVEVTRPEILQAMQKVGQLQDFDPETGRRKSDGAVVTMENPWARQQTQLERATGFDDMTPSQGVLADVAGQTAPAWAQIASALNIDLYRSIHDGQVRSVNPREPLGPHVDNIMPTLMSILNPAGVGQHFSQQMDAPTRMSAQQQATAEQQLPGALQSQNLPPWLTGTVAPLGVREAIAGIPDNLTKTAFSAFTGISAPYNRAPKSAGQTLSDPAVVQRMDLQNNYDAAMTSTSNDLMAGKITPQQWFQAYQNAHTPYAEGMKNLYHGAPEYTQGQLGLVSNYLNLANDPTIHDPVTGALDYTKLESKQSMFKANLTPQQVTDLNTGLSKNDQKYPALAMYRAVQTEHDKVYAQAAANAGLSPATMRALVTRYSSLSGPDQKQFLAQHPEVRAYETANRQWEATTMPGLLYGLYYMTPTAQQRLMATQGSTSPQAQEAAADQIERAAHAKP